MNNFHKSTKGIAIILTLCILSLFSACNKSNENQYNPAEISHFGFDSFPAFKDYVFFIDNFASRIYNADSFPFESDVDSIFPSIIALSTNDKITIDGEAWKDKGIRDWSSGGPFELVNHSEDGRYTKTYQVYVNIHQVDPDSMRSTQISGNYPNYEGSQKLLQVGDYLHCFYLNSQDNSLAHEQSNDGVQWSAAALATGLEGDLQIASLCAFQDSFYLINKSGAMFASKDFIQWNKVNQNYKVIDLHGELKGRKHLSNNALIGIVEDSNGQWRFARYEKSWTIGEPVPADFPISEYASVQSTTVTDVDFVVITTGLTRDGQYATSTWSSMDGLYWARISNTESADLLLQGASMFYYDGNLYLLGGKNDQGAYKDLYISENHGINWELAESRKQIKALESPLVNAQIISDEEYIYIFGGNSESDKKMWKAWLNRMLFEIK